VATINNWKTDYPIFLDSIKNGKGLADYDVVDPLYNRAKGMKIKEQRMTDQGVVDMEKELPPDPTSMIFWLKNRQPKQWRDKQETDITTKGESINDLSVLTTEELLKRAEAVSKLRGE
jgi:hypothetical protein